MKTSMDFEKIAKASKWHSRLKTAMISSIAALVMVLIAYMGLSKLTSINGEKIKDYYILRSEIAYPNIDYHTWGYDVKTQFTGAFISHRFKTIAGIEVPFEPFESNYALKPGLNLNSNSDGFSSGDQGKSAYTYTNHYKVPLFYNTNHNYTNDDQRQPTQDIPLLQRMSGQAVEVAITFDKPYTFEEITRLVPSNLQINWYWIGSQSKVDTTVLRLSDQFGMAYTKTQTQTYQETKHQEKAMAKALKKDTTGKQVNEQTSLENAFTFMKGYMEEALAKDYFGSSYGDANNKLLNTKTDIKSYLKANPNAKTAKFAGVILTGRAENFRQIETAKWIFASNIGQSVQIQPYHYLEK
ncbi:anti sigma factor C-terminal domain-containing protein [Streptococcus castoreus]|uniref:anti sigma factor C-terminal domain-containing protein n=1 Tax=Streptococcus castoreus TaxID=254786 RepID=UPI00041FBAB4|nr:anti sigma factor C-terminal domain-containing protein [Streptococcus castoreus]